MKSSNRPVDVTITSRTARACTVRRIAPGASIDQFTLLREVGAGGMGVVYAAHDSLLDRAVAIKLIHPHRQSDPDELDRILREARAMARLSHPNVITVHSIRRWRDTYCVVMELVDGVNLGRWLAEQTRDASQIWPVFALAARGLAAAHDAGLVHRDFKPANVLVDSCGRVKVTDFGLARLLHRDDGSTALRAGAAADDGQILGTPAYMAPEQFGHGHIDARADQFAFCVALFEALYGHRPFGGGTFTAIASAVSRGAMREPDDPSRAPAAVLAVLRRGLSSDRDARFPDMNALADALDRAFADCDAGAASFAALARAEVALQTGEVETARGLAVTVIGRAALERAPLADARARLLLARCAARVGDGDSADAHLRACLKSAAAAGDDALVARAWGMLAYVAAFFRGRGADAESFCLAAEVAVLRADDELARAYVRNQVCAVHEFLGHAVVALDLVGPRDSCDVEAALSELGQLDDAELAARRGLDILERVLGANHPILAFPLDTAASIAVARGDERRGQLLAERARQLERMTGGFRGDLDA